MKRLMTMLVLCAMAAVFSGCAHCERPVERPVIIENPVPVVPPQTRVSYETVKLVEHHDVLSVFVCGEGATDTERQLAGRLVFQAKGGLASGKADVRLDKGASDTILTIRPRLTTIDHDGNYWKLNCDVQAELRAGNAARVLAAKSFKFAAPQRVLGLENAVKPFEIEGGKAVSGWCAKELKQVFDREVKVALLNIELVQSQANAPRNVAEDSRQIMAIGDGMKQMAGLVSYALTGRDAEKGTCTYRVVYFHKDFPNGIGTAVNVMANSIVLQR